MASGLGITANELSYGLRAGEQASRDFFSERTGESVVVLHIVSTSFNGILTKCEVTLCPELRLTWAPGVNPCSAGFISGTSKGAGWSTSMHVAIGVARYTGKALIA